MGIYDRNYYREDQEIPRFRPWDYQTMVTNLIIVNVALYLLNFLFSGRTGAITKALCLRAEDLSQPLQWYRVLTYGFVHNPADPSHILFNMLSLFFLGQAVEAKYGRWEFLRVYLVSIVMGGIVFLLLHNTLAPAQTVLGASGGVIAISMLFVYNYPQAQLMIWGILPVRAWIVGVVTVLINVFGFGQNVAFDVHLVGIAVATLYFFLNIDFSSIFRPFSVFQNIFKSRPKLKVLKTDDGPTAAPSRDEREADRILDKIYREGKDSLTPQEQKFMESYSRRVRQKRGST